MALGKTQLETLSPAYCASLTQASIVACAGTSESELRECVAAAIDAARGVQSRLARFDSRAEESARADLWNHGPELSWFGPYDSRKLKSLRRVFARIPEILAGRRLKVIGDPSNPSFASSLPGIHKISIGKKWLRATTPAYEKVQTFVHEASHIAGRWVADEDPWYGEGDAQAMALVDRPGRPRMMMRSADNLGYYAMDLAENFLDY